MLNKDYGYEGNEGFITIFKDDLEIYCSFKNRLSFKDCKFEGRVKNQFDLPSTFDDEISFKNCKFYKDVSFYYTIFNKKVCFKDCNFDALVSFSNCKFQENVYFNNSTFDNFADFHESEFKKVACFYGATFKKTPNFSQAKFKDLDVVNININFSFDSLKNDVMEENDRRNNKGIKTSFTRVANDFRDSFRLFKSALIKDNNLLEASKFHKFELYCKEIELHNIINSNSASSQMNTTKQKYEYNEDDFKKFNKERFLMFLKWLGEIITLGLVSFIMFFIMVCFCIVFSPYILCRAICGVCKKNHSCVKDFAYYTHKGEHKNKKRRKPERLDFTLLIDKILLEIYRNTSDHHTNFTKILNFTTIMIALYGLILFVLERVLNENLVRFNDIENVVYIATIFLFTLFLLYISYKIIKVVDKINIFRLMLVFLFFVIIITSSSIWLSPLTHIAFPLTIYLIFVFLVYAWFCSKNENMVMILRLISYTLIFSILVFKPQIINPFISVFKSDSIIESRLDKVLWREDSNIIQIANIAQNALNNQKLSSIKDVNIAREVIKNNGNILNEKLKLVLQKDKINDYQKILDSWDTSNVRDMGRMFFGALLFNGSIDSWNVANVENMNGMFSSAESFNQSLNSWDTSKVRDMSGMFSGAKSFNQNINSWNVSNVENMESMFRDAMAFNQPLDSWDICKVSDTNDMFLNAESFNQNLDSWDIGNVVDMSGMFSGAKSLNQPLDSWRYKLHFDCATYQMFENTPLEGTSFIIANMIARKDDKYLPSGLHELRILVDSGVNLGNIDTSEVSDMSELFADTEREDFSGIEFWNVSNVKSMNAMFYDAKHFNADISKWDISNVEDMWRMLWGAESFNQNLESWGDKIHKNCNVDAMLEGSAMCENLPFWLKLESIKKVNDKFVPNSKMQLRILIRDKTIHLGDIDTSEITDMSELFVMATRMDFSGIESWDTSKVVNMRAMFKGDYFFDEDIDSWDIRNVKDMAEMFAGADNFTQSLESWEHKIAKDCDTRRMFGVNYDVVSYAPQKPQWYIKRTRKGQNN